MKATLHLDARQRYGITLNAALSVMFSMTSGTMRSLANITAVSPMRSAESHACRQQLGRVSCWRDHHNAMIAGGCTADDHHLGEQVM